MTEPPKNLDLGIFESCELIQIWVGRHELILAFFDRVTVTVFSQIIHCDEFNRKNIYQNFSTAPVTLANLFSIPILNVESSEFDTLRLEFKNNHIVEIIKDKNMMESYIISHDNKIVLVK